MMQFLPYEASWKRNQCNKCGKFIPKGDFESGKASMIKLNPYDSNPRNKPDFYEFLCKHHRREEVNVKS